MVSKIAELKNKLIEKMDASIRERGIERADVKELGELSDAIKDLATAEKECWEAEYYCAITEAMDKQGYMPDGDMGGYGNMGNTSRQGYRDSRGRYARRSGYDSGYGSHINELRNEMMAVSPEEREKMQRELRPLLNM